MNGAQKLGMLVMLVFLLVSVTAEYFGANTLLTIIFALIGWVFVVVTDKSLDFLWEDEI